NVPSVPFFCVLGIASDGRWCNWPVSSRTEKAAAEALQYLHCAAAAVQWQRGKRRGRSANSPRRLCLDKSAPQVASGGTQPAGAMLSTEIRRARRARIVLGDPM